jgi:hypothetical protein
MFADNAHAGRLVRSLCTDITRRAQQSEDADLHEAMEAAERRMAATTAEEKQGIDSELAALQHRRRLLRGLLIHERDPAVASAAPASHAPSASEAYDPFQPASTAVMIDQSVYTRNRSFRLLLSSKNAPAFLVSPPSQSGYDAFTHPPPQLESPPVLLVSARNEFPLQGVELKDIFRATLISNVECTRDRLKLLTFNERDEAAVIPATEFSTTPASQDVSTVSVGGSTNPNGKRIRAAAASSSGSSTSRRFHSGPSPFPRVEKFLLQHIHSPASNGSKTTATSQDGRISGWTYVKDSAGGAEGDNSVLTRHSITFNLSYHRYCGNVGRAHVSNGVYYVVDLLARTMDQRCWDHDCRYYRSPPITVPNFVVDMDLDDQDQEAEEIDADA